MDAGGSLSAEVEEILRLRYAPEVQAELRAALVGYSVRRPGWAPERVQYDVLHLADGDPAKVLRLLGVADQDPRDVMSGEYFWRAGRAYPYDWARRHPVNRDQPEAPPVNPAWIAVAHLTGGWWLKQPRPPRSWFLAFSDADNLRTFASKTATIAENGHDLDLAPVLEYRRDLHAPEHSVLRCVEDGTPESLHMEGSTLFWDGSAAYWRECSRRVEELAKSVEPADIGMMNIQADQQVLIGFSPPGAARRVGRWY
jgi:hypothetical protein